MNNCIFMGRLTADPQTRYGKRADGTDLCVAQYTLAIDRQGEGADFPTFKAFGKSGEFAEKYLRKGMKIAVESHVQTGSYTNKDGVKVYTVEFVVDHQEFCEKKPDGSNAVGGSSINQPSVDADGFAPVADDDLPFAINVQ